MTTVSEEKTLNPRLTKSKEEFVEIMKKLGLAYPKKIGELLCSKFVIMMCTIEEKKSKNNH